LKRRAGSGIHLEMGKISKEPIIVESIIDKSSKKIKINKKDIENPISPFNPTTASVRKIN
jgi:hypothetical protein